MSIESAYGTSYIDSNSNVCHICHSFQNFRSRNLFLRLVLFNEERNVVIDQMLKMTEINAEMIFFLSYTCRIHYELLIESNNIGGQLIQAQRRQLHSK